MANVVKIADIAAEIEKKSMQSAWGKGVKSWALSLLLDKIQERVSEVASLQELEDMALNGAKSWRNYCEGGCAIIYDTNIAEQFCSPSELRKTNGGIKAPNARETWMDVQCRAAVQAWSLISDTFETLFR